MPWRYGRQLEEETVNRSDKVAEVEYLQGRFQQATVTLVASSLGLSVAKMQELRRALKQAGGEYRVAKNTLARRALKDTAYRRLDDLMVGPTGLVFGYGDPVAVTKVLVRFAEENEKLSIKAAVLDERVLEAAAVVALAKLPSREVLLAMLLGLLQAPAVQLLRTMQEPGARLVRLLDRARASREEKA
jgi:large subunit ribosomal protein L10